MHRRKQRERERQRETERGRERDRERQTDRQNRETHVVILTRVEGVGGVDEDAIKRSGCVVQQIRVEHRTSEVNG